MIKIYRFVVIAIFVSIHVFSADPAIIKEDEYLWLEEIDGEKALQWVQEQNQRTAEKLKKNPLFDSLYKDAIGALNSQSRIPDVSQEGGYLYNFWKDDQHERGIYRRTTLAEFRKENPNWETVLDLDQLSEKEGRKWTFKGITCLSENPNRCLMYLSPGGGDAVEVREWDMAKLQFVPDGFTLPVAKSSVNWIDENTIYVATDFGKDSMTESGYPRTVKIWKRSTPISEAQTIFTAEKDSVSASTFSIDMQPKDVDLLVDSTTFWEGKYFQVLNGELQELQLPSTAVVNGGYEGRIIFSIKENWSRGDQTFEQGSVLMARPETLKGGQGKIEILVRPDQQNIVEDVSTSEAGILVTMLEKVTNKLFLYNLSSDKWKKSQIPFPEQGAIHLSSVEDESGAFFATYESFTVPSTLYYAEAPGWKPEKMKAQEATFDGSKFEVEQYWTASKDGTKIPYFVVLRKGLERNGKNPTHIFSYGGFRNSLTPSYSGSYEKLSGAYGKMWLERGGVFVLANIRGGGEFGPQWHQAALKENHYKSYGDFEAVAEDLIKRKITSSDRIGIEGRSNGGLLVLSTMIRRPDLYGAVICGVPLADMKRYHKLLAGASWMAEYGNPDIEAEWAYISEYSPYQNLKPGKNYPPVFFFGSRRDDRVHPGHGRKMAARMQEMGYEVYYYENIEGGHGGSSTNEQLAYRIALSYTHLWSQLQ
jgi:prolyl oligopeptidase